MTRRPARPTPSPVATGVVRPPMPLDELDRWLRTPRPRTPVADSRVMLDGFLTAIVVGPVTYEPLGWICPLLGVSKDAYCHGDTPEFAAIAAVAEHHNALAATLSERPHQFTPIFSRSETGTVDVGPWCRGFYAAIQLNPKYWRPPARAPVGPSLADPHPGALHRPRRPPGPGCPTPGTAHRPGPLRRPSQHPARRRRHARILGPQPLQPRALTAKRTKPVADAQLRQHAAACCIFNHHHRPLPRHSRRVRATAPGAPVARVTMRGGVPAKVAAGR